LKWAGAVLCVRPFFKKQKIMNTFKERLAVEKQELDAKLDKLAEFKVSDKFLQIDGVQMSLLDIQFKAMETYSQCLRERIMWLEKNATTENSNPENER
jgi:hypothetical protein